MIRILTSRFSSFSSKLLTHKSLTPYLMPRLSISSPSLFQPTGLTGLTNGVFHFSLKMRKVKAKMLSHRKVKLYKMKTHSGFKKRFWVTGGLNEKQFKFKSAGARHLMRNKSWKCKIRKRRMKSIKTRGDVKRA